MNRDKTVWRLAGAVIMAWAVLVGGSAAAQPPSSAMSELERYVRIQIEIGAAMHEFFSTMGPDMMNPPPDRREEMVEQINDTVESILTKYDLTTEEYNRRKRDVFADDDAVKAFLEDHPALKSQWEALPFKGGSHGRRPYGG